MDGEADEVSDGRDGWMFLLVPAYPGSPGPTAVTVVCVQQQRKKHQPEI